MIFSLARIGIMGYLLYMESNKGKVPEMTNAMTGNAVGRPYIFGQMTDNPQTVAKALRAIGTEKQPSVYLLKQLKEAGLVQNEPIKTEKRGRPAYLWTITERAKRFLDVVEATNQPATE